MAVTVNVMFTGVPAGTIFPPFPGTIWVGAIANGSITVFEPNDYGAGTPTCTGADSTTLDEDADGYSNADELDNGTDPCSAGDLPPDADHDFISNLNDPDDDNDGVIDTTIGYLSDWHRSIR